MVVNCLQHLPDELLLDFKSEHWARSMLDAGVSGFPDSWSENDPVCLTQESSLRSETHILSQARNADMTLIIGKSCKGCRIRTYTLDVGEVSSGLPQQETGLPFGVPSSGLYLLL
jgi:hypothetical protein